MTRPSIMSTNHGRWKLNLTPRFKARGMKAIDRLNEYLDVIPEKFHGTSPMTAPTLVDTFQEADPFLTNALAMMFAQAATFGKVRVAYDIPGEMAEQLFYADMEKCLDLDASMIQFPHPKMFVMAKKPDEKAWEFFLVEGETEVPGTRLVSLTDMDSVTPIFLRDGFSIRACIATSISYFDKIEGFREETVDRFQKYAMFIIKLSLFLTATRDYEDEQIRPLAGGGKRNRNKPSYLKTPGLNRVVGGKFESALRLWREKKARTEPGDGTHASPKPHVRAGHFHLYHTGTGRTVPKVKFLHPCLVNADDVSEVDIQRTVKV